MIRVTCPGCGSKLKAKEELLGETRKCPKCSTVVLISVSQTADVPAAAAPVSTVLDEPAAGSEIHGASDIALKHEDLPERLDRLNHYLICDKSKLVATWEDNGQGWMLKTSFGLVSATRNYEQLPTQGDFKFVELVLEMTDDGKRLKGIRAYRLAERWALTTLDKGDNQIVSKITTLGFLNREQKSVVRNTIRDQFMRQVWEKADNVLDYLASTDYHSPGTE